MYKLVAQQNTDRDNFMSANKWDIARLYSMVMYACTKRGGFKLPHTYTHDQLVCEVSAASIRNTNRGCASDAMQRIVTLLTFPTKPSLLLQER